MAHWWDIYSPGWCAINICKPIGDISQYENYVGTKLKWSKFSYLICDNISNVKFGLEDLLEIFDDARYTCFWIMLTWYLENGKLGHLKTAVQILKDIVVNIRTEFLVKKASEIADKYPGVFKYCLRLYFTDRYHDYNSVCIYWPRGFEKEKKLITHYTDSHKNANNDVFIMGPGDYVLDCTVKNSFSTTVPFHKMFYDGVNVIYQEFLVIMNYARLEWKPEKHFRYSDLIREIVFMGFVICRHYDLPRDIFMEIVWQI